MIFPDVCRIRKDCTINDYEQFQQEILTDSFGCKYQLFIRINGTYKFKSWNNCAAVGLRIINLSSQNTPIKRRIKIILKNMAGGLDYSLNKIEVFNKLGHFAWFYEYISHEKLFGDENNKSMYIIDGDIHFNVIIDV